MLSGFVDSVLQMFENCRAGLDDGIVRAGGAPVERFFAELYEKERPRLQEIIRQQEQHLSDGDREELFERVDERLRKVVIPAYARITARFTPRERNDFYYVPEHLHGLERLAWTAGGIGLGALAVAAPFIPLWDKEWIVLFAVAGLFFPNIRRLLALRRYQAELNALVGRTDDEIWRMDLAYITDDMTEASVKRAREESLDDDALQARLKAASPKQEQGPGPAKRRNKEGGR
jgi:hypothetical protein